MRVINLQPDICLKLRDARREAGLSQSFLASEVGCKQSALSMFEQGDGTKLSDETISKLCERFGISLEKKVELPFVAKATIKEAGPRRGFCPNVNCPSNYRYEVDGKIFVKPNRIEQDPVGGKFCAICGEILEQRCPNCGSFVHDGAICSLCGHKYIEIA